MTTRSTHKTRFVPLAIATLLSSLLAVRPATADSRQEPQITSYHHAPVTLWFVPHVGLFGLSSAKLRTNFALSLGASGYAQLEGIDVGVGASWITEGMRGAQVTAGLNHVGADAWGIQIAAGANVTRQLVTGLQVSSGFNYAGAGLRGVQIAAGANVVRGRATGLQVASGFSYSPALDGAQVGIVNIGGEVNGAQIGLINIGRRIRGAQIGLINVAEDSSAPIGMLNLVKDGQHHLSLWSSDSAPLNFGVKLGGRYLYGVLAAGLEISDGKKRWLAGIGFGGHVPVGERLYVEAELLTWKVNEDEAWTREVNSLNTLRLMAGYRLHRHLSLFAGPTLNLLVTELGDGEGFGLIRGTRLTADDSRTTVRIWPGFVAGIQI